jgi:hypothetical protein
VPIRTRPCGAPSAHRRLEAIQAASAATSGDQPMDSNPESWPDAVPLTKTAPVRHPRWLLRPAGPARLRTQVGPEGREKLVTVPCVCRRQPDWLIIADEDTLEFLCRCGRSVALAGVRLDDVVTLVHESITPDPSATGLARQIRAFGFTPRLRGKPYHWFTWPHFSTQPAAHPIRHATRG